MPNTKSGGVALRTTMINRYGSEAAWKEAMAELGRKGGGTPHAKPKGFAALSPEQRRIASLKGWESRRRNDQISKQS